MNYCTHCGAEIPAGAKFCVTCGKPVQATVSAVQPTQPASSATTQVTKQTATTEKATVTSATAPKSAAAQGHHQNGTQAQSATHAQATATLNPQVAARIDDTKQFATNYWHWFVSSLKAPFNTDQQAHAYFGMVTFALLAVLNALGFYVLLRHFEQTAIAAGASVSSLSTLFGVTTNGTSFFTLSTFLKFLLLYLIIYVGAVLISYVMQIGPKTPKLFDFTNRYAHTSNYVLVPAIVVVLAAFLVPTTVATNSSDLLTSFLSSTKLFVGALAVESVVLHIGMIASVLKTEQEKFDRIYRAIGAVILTGIFNYIVLDLAMQSVATNLLRNFNWSDLF
jgi:hypothetical protein